MTTTPTGIKIADCAMCGGRHPITRGHCDGCKRSSIFLFAGRCLVCHRKELDG